MPAPVARRESMAYRLTPIKGQPEPPADVPVHFMRPDLTTECRISGAFVLKTALPSKVTCPKCRKKARLGTL